MNQKIIFCLTMIIFGTIGLVRKYIPLSSGIVAFVRALIGSIVLIIFMMIKKHTIDQKTILQNKWKLLLSGILLGFNWILLFESYRYTSIAIGTLCYYMAPIFVVLTSPFFLKEKLTRKKMICMLIAFIGMIFVSGLLEDHKVGQMIGIFYGLGSAIFYSGIMITNKKMNQVNAYDKTLIQLMISTIVLIPYLLFTEDLSSIILTKQTIVFLLIAGIIHTGLAYVMYFGSMSYLEAHTIALYSYIDPVVAIIISAVLLGESMSYFAMIGGILILGSTIYSELNQKTP